MKVLSLTQPWCTLVARGLKPVENRNQLFKGLLGQPFLLHASLKWDGPGASWIADHYAQDAAVMAVLRGDHVKGAVIGLARALGYMHGDRYWDHANGTWTNVPAVQPLLESRWYFGRGGGPGDRIVKYGYVLDEQRELAPLLCRGALGLWELPAELEETLVARRVEIPMALPAPPAAAPEPDRQLSLVKG